MHRFSTLLVVAVIAAAGEALSVVGNPWDTTSDELTSSSSSPALAVQDVTDAGVNLPLDIMTADMPCSPQSIDQTRSKQPSKLRRRQICYPDRSQGMTSPPNGREQGQQPQQISNPDKAENFPSGARPNDGTNLDYSDFSDSLLLCNPLIVGLRRKFPICDSGRVGDRSIFLGSVDPVNSIMTSGAYVLFDVTPVSPLHGCFGSSISWCCESIGFVSSGTSYDGPKVFGSDCVPIQGPGIVPGAVGPIVP